MYDEAEYQRPAERKRLEDYYCYFNIKKYLRETTLHGLRFIGDEAITIWERGFFFWVVVCALASTAQFVNYFFAKWDSTPLLIGVSPYPTTIADIPFPAITLCNMNQLSLSKVQHFSNTSFQHAMMDMACFSRAFEDATKMPDNYKHNNLSITEFLIGHAQPCSSLVISCNLNSISHNCSEFFETSLADEGMCCAFNILHPKFLYKINVENETNSNNPSSEGVVAVNWSPETGYPENLPKNYYPRPAAAYLGGIFSLFMGFSCISIAEFIYFAFTRPFFNWILPKKQVNTQQVANASVWLGEELFPDRRRNTWHDAPIWHITNYRKFRNITLKSPYSLKRLQSGHKVI